MYCRFCKFQLDDRAVACPNCGMNPRLGYQYCWNCGNETNPHQVICVHCGVSLKKPGGFNLNLGDGKQVYNPNANPFLAGILSCLIPGLGQMVIGQAMKGLAILLVSIFGVFLLFIPSLIVGIGSIVDAVLVAQKLQRGEPVGEWEFLPGMFD